MRRLTNYAVDTMHTIIVYHISEWATFGLRSNWKRRMAAFNSYTWYVSATDELCETSM